MSVNGLLQRWREEQQSVWLYGVLAGVEKDAQKAALFRKLAGEAAEQAGLIVEELKNVAPETPPPAEFTPDPRTRLVGWLLRRVGPRAMLPVLAAMKVRGISVYRSATPEPGGHPMPTSVSQIGEGHRGGGGSLRAAVFGVNDGLVSNAALIMGVAGATSDNQVILLSGMAGLLAGAFSMAAGEYVSMRSQREMFEYQIGQEKEELELYPEAEAEELALIYQARGVPLEEARRLAGLLVADKAKALDALAREELGLNPDELGSPWGAAISSFLSFVAGAVVPLAPFFFAGGRTTVLVSAGLAGVGLFAVGATLSLFTGRRAWWGGLRMLAIGAMAGLATYLIGGLLGADVR
jgi:VIT1/CCC1 family predicted Fe2+/Mn2+ transporter